jgi:catechol 2,3-dioxygenase-like lactoylglutathione lyase family enzyme
MRLNHLHLHVRDRRAAEAFYARWLEMTVLRHGESLTFLSDEDGFDLALMDDQDPIRMPPWFHFGCRMKSAREVIDIHDRMSDSGVVILKPLYEDDAGFVPLRRSGRLRDASTGGGAAPVPDSTRSCASRHRALRSS